MNDGAIIDLLGGTAAVARLVNTQPASVSEWRRNGIPAGRLIELAAEIERRGGPPRRSLRPHDWHRIWPELVGTDGAPAAPCNAQRCAA